MSREMVCPQCGVRMPIDDHILSDEIVALGLRQTLETILPITQTGDELGFVAPAANELLSSSTSGSNDDPTDLDPLSSSEESVRLDHPTHESFDGVNPLASPDPDRVPDDPDKEVSYPTDDVPESFLTTSGRTPIAGSTSGDAIAGLNLELSELPSSHRSHGDSRLADFSVNLAGPTSAASTLHKATPATAPMTPSQPRSPTSEATDQVSDQAEPFDDEPRALVWVRCSC